MSRSASSHPLAVGLAVIATAGLLGCEIDPQQYQFGFNVSGLEFNLYSEDMGIHPSQDVLLDPNNPFVEYGVGAETKWDILAEAGNVGAFYAWATILSSEATGEHQFYTAIKLRDIYQTGEVPDEELPIIRDMAVRGFQSVLDSFPESVTYDPTGTRTFRLATFAFNEIVALGATVQGDWVLVQLPNGGTEAVRSSILDPGRAVEGDTDDG